MDVLAEVVGGNVYSEDLVPFSSSSFLFQNCLSITKVNLDINPEILMKTKEMLMETLGSGSRPLCRGQQLTEIDFLKPEVKHI